jgi:hypothetical protein
MLPKALLFATSKMLIYFQKRFGGVARLTAIWVGLFDSWLSPHRRLEKFDPKINPDKWLAGFKPQRGEIFVEK